jgi:hypothetical protein
VKEQGLKVGNINALQKLINKEKGTLRRFQRGAPKLKANIDAIKAAAEEGTALHKNTRLHMTILAKNADRELELATFSGEVAADRAAK